MRRTTRLAALLLALALALSCTACGKQKTLVADTTSDTKQEQTTGTRKDDTAKTDTAKADSKQDAAKTEDKTVDDKKPDEQKAADEAEKAAEDTQKQEEAKRLEEQKRQEEEKKQQEQEQQPTAPDPDPEPAPAPDPTPAASVSLYISCANAVGVQSGLPAGGVLLSSTISITPGETVMQVLQRACRDAGIPMVNKSGYISAIGGVYDHISDAYPSSGWMYCVDGWFPNYGAGSYTLSGGESIQWLYTLDGGADVGNTYMG